MLIIRIMQAEVAAAGGRLEEAVAALRDPRVLAHRRGQALADRLVAALVARGRAHLSAGRHREAAADADRALAVGGSQPAAVDLRADADAAAAVVGRADRDATLAVAAARRHLAAGDLSAGERRLADLRRLAAGRADDTRAVLLMDDLAIRREQLAAALRDAEAALAADLPERAAAALARGRSANVADARLDDLAARVAAVVCRRVAEAVRAGKLDVAQRLAASAGPDAETEPLRLRVGQFRVAWERFEAGRFRESEEALRRAAELAHDGLPNGPGWLADAVAHLRRAADAADAVRAGPLGWLAAGDETRAIDGPVGVPVPAAPAAGRPVALPPLPPLRPAAPVSPAGGREAVAADGSLRFVLRVDGVGSFLVIGMPTVTLGPVSGRAAADLGFVADPTVPPATIERTDDDYFLRPAVAAVGGAVAVGAGRGGQAAAADGATVNGKPIGGTARLLADGDRVALSPRVRFAFALPHPASTSAVLHLSGARLPAADVRRVVLMDRDVVVGPGPSAHVRTDGLSAGGGPDGPTVVLFLQGGRLCCAVRPGRDASAAGPADVRVDGRPAGPHAEVPVGAQVRAGGVSFVVTPA